MVLSISTKLLIFLFPRRFPHDTIFEHFLDMAVLFEAARFIFYTMKSLLSSSARESELLA